MQNLFKVQTIHVLSSLFANPLYKQNTEKQNCQESYMQKERMNDDKTLRMKSKRWCLKMWMNENENKNYDGKQLFKLQFVVTGFIILCIRNFCIATVYTFRKLNMTISSSWVTADLNGYIFYKIYESVEGSFLNKNRTQILLVQTSFITKPYFDFFKPFF